MLRLGVAIEFELGQSWLPRPKLDCLDMLRLGVEVGRHQSNYDHTHAQKGE